MLSALIGFLPGAKVLAEGTLCAEVRLEIKQEATLEREAFDAALEVANQYPAYGLTNFRVNIIVKDQQGANADNLFFIKISSKEAISAVDGTGTIQPASTATVHWLIIPSTGAGGANPLGITYSIRADISYDLNGVHQSISTFDDNIVVKPQPALKLEYVLPFEVFADEALTAETIEPVEPFPLGVRITNVGYGPAKNFQINSGQPKIIENKQGLDIDFKLLGTYVGDKKIPDTLLIPFGDISAGAVTQSAWIMATSLSGRFTKFDATFTHAAELGGQLTSLIKDVTTYTLVKDMLVDLPGRDSQFDFLVNTTTPRGEIEALLNAGGEVVPNLILESDQAQPINVVHLPSALTGTLSGANTSITLKLTEAAGANLWVFASAPAPQDGKAVLVSAVRQDGKAIDPKNVWISKHFNKSDTKVTYRLNIIDYNPPSEAEYTLTFSRESLDAAPAPISDLSAFTTQAGGQTSLSWSATGEDASTGTIIGGRYLIQAATSPTSEFRPTLAQVNITTNTAPGVAQSYLLGSLAGNASYYVKLWLQDTGGNISADSNLAEAFVLPNPPKGLVVGSISSNTAAVTWDGGNNNLPIEYGVWADTDAALPAASSAPFKDSFDRAFVFAGLTPNTTYNFYGLAKNPESGITSEQAYLGEALTLAAEPGQIQSSQLFTSSFTVAWDAGVNSGLTEYFVQVSTASNWSVTAAESGWVNQPSYAFSGLASDTTYYLRAKARNVAGVETAYADIGILRTAAVDTLAPVTAISFAGPYFSSATVYVSSFTEISLAASDDAVIAGDNRGAMGVVRYALDSDTFSVYAGTFSIVGGGEHVVRYYGTDAAGNTEEVKTSSVTVDDVAPAAQVEIAGVVFSSASISYVPAASTVTLTAADGASGIKELYYDVNGSTYTVAAASKTLELGEGSYALGYSAADNIGNVSEVKVSSVVVDNTAPRTEFAIEGSSQVIEGALYAFNGSSITLSAADALAGVKEIAYSLDGSTYTAAAPLVLPVTAGEHVLTFYAVDNVGNAELERSVTYFMDAEAPVATAAVAGLPGANGWYVSPVSLTLDSTDTLSGIAGITYSLDRVLSETERVLLSSGAYTGRLDVGAEGVYSYAYSAADRAGNISTETTGGFKIDLGSPEVVALSWPAANDKAWNNSTVTAMFSSTDNVSGIAFCSPSILLELEGSSQTIDGYCTDFAGHTSTASVTVNIDTTAPASTAAISGSGNNGYYGASIAVTIASTDALSGVTSTYYSLDGGEFAEYQAPVQVSADGRHTVRYYAKDNAGNEESPQAVEVNIDTTAPVVSYTATPQANSNGWNNSNVEVVFTGTDTLSGIASCTSTVTVSVEGGSQTVVGSCTDLAGNIAYSTAIVSLDLSTPAVSAAGTPAANASGWNNTTVSVVFTGTDSVSGLASCTSPAQIAIEGSSQVVNGYCADFAGLVSTTAYIVSIDTTAPSLAYGLTPAANAAGWNNSDVAVSFTCADALSGVASCPPATTLSSEGVELSTAAAVYDFAGNSSEATVAGIKIDRTAPVSTAAISGTNNNGYYGAPVAVTIASTDTLSGVTSAYYSLDGGEFSEYQAPIQVSTDGPHTVRYYAKDNAGNEEARQAVELNIDTTAPVISYAVAPEANSNGWNNSTVEVVFTGTDTLSGIASCTSTVTVSVEGGSQTVVGSCTDLAGNIAYSTAIVSVDLSTPEISAAGTPAANKYGWNNTPVSVVFAGTDSVSGLVSCTPGAQIGIEGSNQPVNGYCTDRAGLVSTVTYLVSMDTTAPSLGYALLPAANAAGWNNTNVAVNFTCADALSGVASCPADIALSTEGVELSTAASAYDFAGNSMEATVAGIKIDRTAPVSTAAVSGIDKNGYYGASVEVTIGSTDTLSGVANTYYSLDGAEFAEYQAPVQVSTDGPHTVRYYAKDNAGNEEARQAVELNIDTTAPVISYAVAPEANSNGWNNSTVEVVFTGIDTLSGIAFCTSTVTVSVEGGSQTVVGSCADLAGNIAYSTAIVSVDLSTPEISAAGNPAANMYGWNNTPVSVVFAGTDSVSGLVSCTPAAQIGIEGSSQPVNGYCTDRAGLVSTATYLVSMDTTAPSLGYALLPAANAAGWNNTNVAVNFTCADALSGVASCPADIALSTEGVELSTAAAAYDFAGNSMEATVAGIKIDRTAPISTAAVSGIDKNGYYGASVAVTIGSTDTLSGVANTYYSLDGGEFAEYQAPIVVASEGPHAVRYYAQDAAGNAEAEQAVEFNIDLTGPSISYTAVPQPNSNGWNNSVVEVVFTGTDTLSGIASCTPARTVSVEGGSQTVVGSCTDLAGNIAYSTAIISVDLSKPEVSAAGSPAANASGWNNTPVSIVFAGTDSVSGIAFCTPAAQLALEGSSQTVVGSCTDLAGNIAYSTAIISVDLSKPEVSGMGTPAANASGWNNTPVSIVFTGTDSVSGLATCTPGTLLELEGSSLTIDGSCSNFAGLTSTASVTVNIDTTAPVSAIAFGGTYLDGSYESSVTVSLESSDALSGVAEREYALDGGAFKIFTSTFAIETPGEHTLVFRAKDLAGNQEHDRTALVNIVQADVLAPVTEVVVKGVPVADGASVTISSGDAIAINSVDQGSGLFARYYAVNTEFSTAPAAAYTVPFTLDPGTYTIRYAAVDNAGNLEAVKNARITVQGLVGSTITIGGAPEVVFTAPVNGLTITKVEVASASGTIVMAEAAAKKLQLVSNLYELGPDGDYPAGSSVTFAYSMGGLPAGISESEIAVYEHSSLNGWTILPGQARDTATHRISAPITSIASVFALFAPESAPAPETKPTAEIAVAFTPNYAGVLPPAASAEIGVSFTPVYSGVTPPAASVELAVEFTPQGYPQTYVSQDADKVLTVVYQNATADGVSAAVTVESVPNTDSRSVLALAAASGAELPLMSALYEVGPARTTFTPEAEVIFKYDEAQLGEVAESALNVYRYDAAAGWQKLDVVQRNTEENWISVKVDHLCLFGIFNSTATAPAAFLNVNGLSVAPGSTTYVTNSDSVTLTGNGLAATLLYSVDTELSTGTAIIYTVPFTLAVGTHTVYYTAVDSSSVQGEVKNAIIVSAQVEQSRDSIPPFTTVFAKGVELADGATAYMSAADTFVLVSTDPDSGVEATYYAIDAEFSTMTATAYTAPFTLITGTQTLTIGAHTLSYMSVDRAGNMEAVKRINVITSALGFHAAGKGYNAVRWSWNSASWAEGYQVFSATGGAVSDRLGINETSYLQTGLLSGTTYSNYLKVYRAGGEEAVPVASAITAPAPLDRITDLTAKFGPGEWDLTIAWTAPGCGGGACMASSYDIRWSTTPLFDATFAAAHAVPNPMLPAAAGTTQQMVLTGFNALTGYYFGIKAVDEVGNLTALSNQPIVYKDYTQRSSVLVGTNNELVVVSPIQVTLGVVSTTSAPGSEAVALAQAGNLVPVSNLYEVAASTDFDPAAKLTFSYSSVTLQQANIYEAGLSIYRFSSDSGWVKLGGQQLDINGDSLSAQATSAGGLFAVLGATQTDNTPPDVRVFLNGSPSPMLDSGSTTTVLTTDMLSLTAYDDVSGVKTIKYSLDSAYSAETATTYSMPFYLAIGTHTLYYTAFDYAGNQALVRSIPLIATVNQADMTPPVTLPYADGVRISSETAGYLRVGTVLTLTAADPLVNGVASGVARITYDITATYPNQVVVASGTYSGPFTFQQEGVYTLSYGSVDNSGNWDGGYGSYLTYLVVDGTAPLTALTAAGAAIAPNTTGYITTSGAIALMGADIVSGGVMSGVTSTYYLIDVAPADMAGPCPVSSGACAGSVYSTFFTLAAGNHVVYYASVDRAGNQEAFKTVYLNVSSSAAAGIATYVSSIGSYGSGAGQLDGPSGVSVSPGNVEIYVADSRNHRVQKFSSYGKFLLGFGSAGSGQGQFGDSIIAVGPGADTVSNNNQIYVADPGNYRIQRFGHYGDFLSSFGSHGSGPGQFETLAGIAIAQPGSEVYAVDSALNKVSVFLMTTGALQREFGSAGSGPGQFNAPKGVAMRNGMVYVTDTGNRRVQKFTAAGGFMGEWASDFITPYGIWVDASDRVFVSDSGLDVVEVFDNSGALLGKFGASGSGAGQIENPTGIGGDKTGFIYVADTGNNRVQRFKLTSLDVTPPSGIAGLQITNVSPFSVTAGFNAPGDGGPMVAAYDLRYSTVPLLTSESLRNAMPAAFNPTPLPAGMYQQVRVSGLLPGGTYYFAIRSQDSSGNASAWTTWQAVTSAGIPAGTLSMLSGGVTSSVTGAAPLSLAYMGAPSALTIDKSGNLYSTHISPQSVAARSDLSTFVMSRVAGYTPSGYSGDGGPALEALLGSPVGVALDGNNNVVLADTANNRIRMVSAVTGAITSVAGNGTAGSAGDGGPAVNAALNKPMRPAVDAAGNIYFADSLNNKIRRIDAVSGVITAVAGVGTAGFAGDGGPAASAALNSPSGVRFGPDGSIYVADTGNNRIRKIGTNGIIVTVAGNGAASSLGDGGAAVAASINGPVDTVLDPVGNMYIAEQNGNKVRKVSAAGVITTAAGTGVYLSSNAVIGDVPAAQATVSKPVGVAVDAARGMLYIADNFHILGVGITISSQAAGEQQPAVSVNGQVVPAGAELNLTEGGPITLTAVDDIAGIQQILYNFNLVDPASGLTPYTAPLTLGVGNYTLNYVAIANDGRWGVLKSALLKVNSANYSADITVPATNAYINGVRTSSATAEYVRLGSTLTFTATDQIVNGIRSGVAFTTYTITNFASSEWVTVAAGNYAAPVILANEGQIVIYYRSRDNNGNWEMQRTRSRNVDGTAPLTAALINGATVEAGASVTITPTDTVTLSANDPISNGVSAGLSGILYTLDTAFSTAAATAYVQPITLPAGAHTLYYSALDNIGNQAPVKAALITVTALQPDSTTPLTKLYADGVVVSSGTAGYLRAGTVLTLVATDALVNGYASGVAFTTYTISQFVSPGWVVVDSGTYTGPLIPQHEGYYTMSYQSRDNAGNLETLKSRARYVDGTAPVTGASVNGVELQVGTTTAIAAGDSITLSAVDPLSNDVSAGVKNILYAIDVDFSTQTAAAYSAPFTLGIGTHTVYFMAVDNVGNSEALRSLFVTISAPVILASITVDPSSAIVTAGDMRQFTASANFSDGTSRALEVSDGLAWSVDYSTVATVGANGQVTGVSNGTARITVSSGSLNAGAKLVVVSSSPEFNAEIAPSSGPIGMPFTVTGSGFGVYTGSDMRVLIGGAASQITLWTDTKIQGTVPGSLAAGVYDLVMERPAGNGVQRSAPVQFTVTAPAIASVVPSSGAIGVPITISGSSFGPYTGRVLIGGATVQITAWNDSKIQGTVPGTLESGEQEVVVQLEADGGLVRSSTAAFNVVTPSIGAVSPSSGPIGIPFALTGANFGNYTGSTTRVLIGGATATITLWTEGRIEGVVSGILSAGDQDIVVERELNGGLVRTAAASYKVVTPVLTSVSPSSGAIGVPFTLLGSNFGAPTGANTSVLFGSTAAAVTLWTDTKIQGIVPGGLPGGIYAVVAERRALDGGSVLSSSGSFQVVAVTVSSMTPLSGPIGIPFTLYGTNFGNYTGSNMRVLIGGTTSQVTLWTDTKIQGTVPGSLVAGVYDVVVQRVLADGTIASTPVPFTLTAPSLTSLVPSSGSIGVPFTVNGTSFGDFKGRVLIGGVSAAITSWADTKIQGTIPGTLASGDYDLLVSREANGGVALTSTATFKVVPPAIGSITPSSGPIGIPITLYGSAFGNYTGSNMRVLIGTTALTTTLWTESKIQGTVPGSLAVGSYELVVERSINGGVVRSSTSTFVVAAPEPVSVTPSTAAVMAPFTLYGHNFGNNLGADTRVLVNGATSYITSWSESRIDGKLPFLPPGTYPLTVERRVGGYSSASEALSITVAAPVISSMTPTSGAAGTVVNVYGTGFGPYDASVIHLTIGGAACAVSVWTDTNIKATVPASLASGTYLVLAARGQLVSNAVSYVIPGGYSPSMLRAGSGASAVNASFELGDVYVYPNPAKGGKAPVFHVEVGQADSVKIKVFTVVGQSALEHTLTGMPLAIEGKYAYEYAWEGHIASGVYYYTIEAERAGKKLKAKGKFAVVR